MEDTNVSKVVLLRRKVVDFDLNRRLIRMICWRSECNTVGVLQISAIKVLRTRILWKALHR